MQTDSAEQPETDLAIIYPAKLNFGVVSAGFLYKYKFSVQNNTTTPMRIRLSCAPIKNEQNAIRLMNLPDIVAPGLAAVLYLELTAEFPMSSRFVLTVTQNHSNAIYTKEIEANVVSTETFKHVKKSLILQKRPIYQPYVKVIANIPYFDTLTDELPNYSSATFSEAVLLDDDDIDELLSLPMTHNLYWDPFAKCLRMDKKLGKVIVDTACSLEENKAKTAAEREERMAELEEQGFLTINSLARMREERRLNPPGSRSVSASHSALFTHSLTEEEEEARDAAAVEAEQDDTFADLGLLEAEHDEEGSGEDVDRLTGVSVSFSEDENHTRTLGSPTGSAVSRMSVASMLAMKRERIERQRHETVMQSATFSETSHQDKKIDRNRTLTMIKSRSKSNLNLPAAGSLE